MKVIRCEVRWSTTDQATFDVDSTQPVDDLVKMVLRQAGNQLPDSDAAGHPIHYALYKIEEDQRTKILGRPSLAAARIEDGAQFYLGDPHALWWTKEETINSQNEPLARERKVGDPQSVIEPSQLPERPPLLQRACRLQVIDGKIIDLPEKGIMLNRSYLLKNLPAIVVIREQLKILFGFDSRISRVSRQPHCEIIRQGQQWFLRALHPTYIDGRMYEGKATIPLSLSTTLTLGRDGWLIEVRLT